jgi:hypothetical protein
MYIHIHIHMPPAWNYVEHVAKIRYPTLKQTRNQVANQTPSPLPTDTWHIRAIHNHKKNKRQQPQKNLIYC